MVTFTFSEHTVGPNKRVVNVFVDGWFKAAIYPDDDTNGIRIISGHLKGKEGEIAILEFEV